MFRFSGPKVISGFMILGRVGSRRRRRQMSSVVVRRRPRPSSSGIVRRRPSSSIVIRRRPSVRPSVGRPSSVIRLVPVVGRAAADDARDARIRVKGCVDQRARPRGSINVAWIT